jgi:uncharacterized protein YabN with tetrapyrrole methylase and pyrophosphatase domain
MVETDNYILDEIAAIREQVVRQHPDGFGKEECETRTNMRSISNLGGDER